jgi:hypothetical protein
MLHGVIQENLQVMNAPEAPVSRQQVTFQVLLNRLLAVKRRRLSIVNREQPPCTVEIALANPKPVV